MKKNIFHTIKHFVKLGLGALKCKFHDIDSINLKSRMNLSFVSPSEFVSSNKDVGLSEG
jgi:hypothetical protein